MGVKGVMINQIEIKTSGDVFHEIWRHRPQNLSTISGDKIHTCDLHEGQWGNVGATINFTFTHEGKKETVKHRVTAIDEDKKLLTYKAVDGDLLKSYKSFTSTAHVETHGESNLVTFTFEYEKLKEDGPYPTTYMDFCLGLVKDIESHHT